MAASVEKLLPCLMHFKMRGLSHRNDLFYFLLCFIFPEVHQMLAMVG